MSTFETNDCIFEILGNESVKLKKCKSYATNYSIPEVISYHFKKYQIKKLENVHFKGVKN